ncbi:TlpA family protein disulfide reductase [Marilutibacter chinensis]|uniref:TlpA family protein disulfide reductase n=1 Tax=Marilutibacter chinensis TaxID=2912247 RepID=A0ABS9HWK7_9GAMM|nr:TlpA disulfide reductase family protein [Lysobacter chinensis]MCF7223284.1 TlpA family protein disulfide reductase [Lysobacter chinensis]
MKLKTSHILLIAVVGAVLGAAVGLWRGGSSPLLRTEAGQRALQGALSATAPAPPQDLPVARRGETVPTVRLPDLDGATVEVPGAYAGRPLLVNFWASWCGPCIEEMPELNRYAAGQNAGGKAGDGTQVVGIALDDADAVREFLARIPVDYPVLIDRAGPRDSSVQLGNPRGVLPYSVLISADGRLLKQKVGPFQSGEIDGWATERD